MKIALIGGRDLQQFPTIGYGGIEICVESLAWGLYDNGHDFVCIVPARKKETVTTDYPFEIIDSPVHPLGGPEANVWPFANSLPDIVRSVRPDIIWSQDFWSAETLQSVGIPIICTFHCFYTDEETKRRWFTFRDNTWYRFLSRFQLKQWVDYREVWHQKRCAQIYSGLSKEEYEFCDENEREDYYLWVAGLGWGLYAKGLNIFLELATRYHDKRFVAYGAGNPALEEELLQISRNVHNFEYRGMLRRGVEHRRAFKRARAFIMPTQTPEPFARTNLEALSKGTPVIGSKKGSLPELIINDVTGYVTDDINVMSDKLDCIHDFRLVYEYSKKFHVNNEIKGLTEWSTSILGGYEG